LVLLFFRKQQVTGSNLVVGFGTCCQKNAVNEIREFAEKRQEWRFSAFFSSCL